MSITLDTSKFDKALRALIAHNKRDASEELNKRARNVIIRAAKATPKAERGKIEASLTKLTITTTTGASGKTLKKPKKRYIPSEIVYKIVAKKQGLPGLSHVGMSAMAKKFIGARLSGIGFVAFAGWNNALKAFGGSGFGAINKNFGNSSAARGSGTQATPETLTATMVNTAAWSDHIARGPLQSALDAEAKEMAAHLESKMQERWGEVSR